METPERSGKRRRRDDRTRHLTAPTGGSVASDATTGFSSTAGSAIGNPNLGSATRNNPGFLITPPPGFPVEPADLLPGLPPFAPGFVSTLPPDPFNALLPDPFNPLPPDVFNSQEWHHINYNATGTGFPPPGPNYSAAGLGFPPPGPSLPVAPRTTDAYGASGLYSGSAPVSLPVQSNGPIEEYPTTFEPVVDNVEFDYLGLSPQDAWANASLFRLDKGLSPNRGPLAQPTNLRSRKRGRSPAV